MQPGDKVKLPGTLTTGVVLRVNHNLVEVRYDCGLVRVVMAHELEHIANVLGEESPANRRNQFAHNYTLGEDGATAQRKPGLYDLESERGTKLSMGTVPVSDRMAERLAEYSDSYKAHVETMRGRYESF